mgnify:CR=1 FL=1
MNLLHLCRYMYSSDNPTQSSAACPGWLMTAVAPWGENEEDAFDQGLDCAQPFQNPKTSALGLRVPSAVGDFLILNSIRQSEGVALSVTDNELMTGTKQIGSSEGIFSAPEGGATVAALPKLLDRGIIKPNDQIVLFITGSGLKYVDLF